MESPSNTVSITLTPITQGFPNIHDDNFTAAIAKAKAGGDATQAWFDAQNQTSDFWGWMADHTPPNSNPFAPAVDPDGNPIQTASSGNVDMRNGAFYRGSTTHVAAPTAGDPPPIVGVGTIQTHNTTSLTSRTMSFGLGIAGIPAGIVLTKALFGDLLSPIYQNFRTWITQMSKQFEQASEVETPDIDPEEEAEGPLEESTADIEEIGGELAEQGAEYLAINWGSVVLEAAGLGAIIGLPFLAQALGHKMVNSVEIHNLTGMDFNWELLDQVHGKASLIPKNADGGQIIPKMDYNVDSWGDHTTVKVSYAANFQFINSTDYTDIGYVLSLTPANAEGQEARAVVAIPWAGANKIWVGASSADPGTLYQDIPNLPAGQLSVQAVFDTYQVTLSINALHGKTDGAYFYGVLGVIEPRS